jgi:mannitol/fructose-specific phosphotransferase system IIA component (Ntr-type)
VIRYISSPNHIIRVSSRTFDEALYEVLYVLLPKMLPSVRWALHKAICQRESINPTILPDGVAFPRAESSHIRKIVCGVGISDSGQLGENPSGMPVHTIFVSVYPKGGFQKFVPLLVSLVGLSRDPEKMTALKRLADHKEEFSVINEEVFPWGLRGLVQSHPFASVHRINNRT